MILNFFLYFIYFFLKFHYDFFWIDWFIYLFISCLFLSVTSCSPRKKAYTNSGVRYEWFPKLISNDITNKYVITKVKYHWPKLITFVWYLFHPLHPKHHSLHPSTKQKSFNNQIMKRWAKIRKANAFYPINNAI